MTADAIAPPRFRLPLFLRTLIGLALAPVVGGALMMVLMMIPDVARTGGTADDFLKMIMFGGMYGAAFGLPGALTLGWAVHLLLLKLRWTSVWVYVGLGALMGVVAFYAASLVLQGID